jgi:hypothetical protein
VAFPWLDLAQFPDLALRFPDPILLGTRQPGPVPGIAFSCRHQTRRPSGERPSFGAISVQAAVSLP